MSLIARRSRFRRCVVGTCCGREWWTGLPTSMDDSVRACFALFSFAFSTTSSLLVYRGLRLSFSLSVVASGYAVMGLSLGIAHLGWALGDPLAMNMGFDRTALLAYP